MSPEAPWWPAADRSTFPRGSQPGARGQRSGSPRCVTPFFAAIVLIAAGTCWAKEPKPAIQFSQGLEAALQQAATQNKPVVAFFQAVWCPVCTRMKRETFHGGAQIAAGNGLRLSGIEGGNDQ